MSLLLALLACGPSDVGSATDVDDTGEGRAPAIADLAALPYGARAAVGPVTVVSPPTRDGTAFYVQEPGTGDGLEVRVGVRWTGPPEVGTSLILELLSVGTAEAPAGWLSSESDLVTLPDAAEPTVLDAPEAPRAWTLARWPALTVLSAEDPSGRADTSRGVPLDARFGVVLPPPGNTGTLTALVLADGALAPRVATDWEGPREEPAVVEATLADVRAGRVGDGTVVRVTATQASPWSRDGRTIVLQEDGVGVWLDAEGWGVRTTRPRDRGVWIGEVRTVGDVGTLRSWTAPELGDPVDFGWVSLGPADPEALPDDGAVVEVDVTGLGRPDAFGERVSAEGLVLDDRFRLLDDAPSDARVRGVVDRRGPTVVLVVTKVLDGREG